MKIKYKLISKYQKGFSVIEILVAIGIFAVIAIGIVPSIVQTFTIARLGDNETDATLYTQEALEATRSIKNQAWSGLTNGAHGLTSGGGVWAFSGTNNIKGIYTRSITVSDVYRDTSGNLLTSGCANQLDLNAKRTVAATTWNSSPTRANNVTLEAYFTNWKKTAFGNWASPSQESSADVSGNQDGEKIQVQGSYAYMIRSTGSPNFIIFDISASTPVAVGSLALTGNPTNIYVLGRYVFVSNQDNAEELQVIDACTPSAPTQVGSFNAAGNADAGGVFASGSYAYIVRSNSADDEFIIINVTTPSAPTLTGSFNLTAAGHEVMTMGNYAFIAGADNAEELKVIDISTPATPSQVGSLNLAGGSDAQTIAGFGSTVLTGRTGGELNIINVATPASPSLTATYNAGFTVNDISLGNANLYAFLGDNNNASELQVIDISVLASPSLLGSVNYSSDLHGVAYSSFNDRVYGATLTNTEELASFKPN